VGSPDVRLGQVWADNDKRSAGRHVKVVGFTDYDRRIPRKAVVALCTADGQVIRINGKDTRTRITITRFRPTSSGYRLVADATTREL
jgi:hypothetical protein